MKTERTLRAKGCSEKLVEGYDMWSRRLFCFAIACAVAAGLSRAAEHGGSKIRVLIVTGGHGFEQQPFFAMFDAMKTIEYKHVPYPKAADLFGPELTEKYDAIVFYDMWNRPLTAEQKERFVKMLQRGIGIVALHHTLGAHQDWPVWRKLIGGKFYIKPGPGKSKSGWRHGQDIRVHIEDPEHPITKGVKDFVIHDETYNKYDTDESVHVLLTTNHPLSDRELAWVKSYGKCRVFYIQLGHGREAYGNSVYRAIVERAIRWSAGRL